MMEFGRKKWLSGSLDPAQQYHLTKHMLTEYFPAVTRTVALQVQLCPDRSSQVDSDVAEYRQHAGGL